MATRYLITGGTGFIGSALVNDWLSKGIDVAVLTRRPGWVEKRWSGRVAGVSDLYQLEGNFDCLVNLAGEGIADARWTDDRKRQLEESRIDLTESVALWMGETAQHIPVVLSGSAIGVYGSCLPDPSRGKACPVATETSPLGTDYAAQLCLGWEEAAKHFDDFCDRRVILRTGVVLGPNGGMLKRLWLPFRMGFGGRVGSGEQVISWIHLDDYVRAINLLIQEDISGYVNMTAPNPATNSELSHTFARSLNRPAIFPLPATIVNGIFGEMGSLLLEGQQVVPEKLMEAGFSFEFPSLENALADVVSRWSGSPV